MFKKGDKVIVTEDTNSSFIGRVFIYQGLNSGITGYDKRFPFIVKYLDCGEYTVVLGIRLYTKLDEVLEWVGLKWEIELSLLR